MAEQPTHQAILDEIRSVKSEIDAHAKLTIAAHTGLSDRLGKVEEKMTALEKLVSVVTDLVEIADFSKALKVGRKVGIGILGFVASLGAAWMAMKHMLGGD